ncbi:Acetokinase family-domain-containing protein [Thelephora terrestris]|uniref:Probable acetate kinase n=1 Tax=Thelephora terrestris TaxID=56493 RepID=A0A9P6L660_9AGAM|nr:Acetokinase family-domain-containing protein [Thelephora terrestris]
MSQTKLILSVNAGSSSIKLSVYSASHCATPVSLVKSSVSGLTSPPATFSYSNNANKGHKVEDQESGDVTDQSSALELFLRHLGQDESLKEHGTGEIELVVHRVVHGGLFREAAVLSEETIKEIEDLTDLAPLHNAAALALVKLATQQLPKAINIAYFDTTFHTRSIPPHVYTYPLDPEMVQRKKIRKYGFHGISYLFVLKEAAEFLQKPPEVTSLISLHLGSGASAVAIKNGKSIDTTMGLTPLEGLPGATRSGSIDPSLVFHYTSEGSSLARSSTKELHISIAEEILNKRAGWYSMVGTTDFGKVVKGMNGGDEKMKLAFDLFVDRIVGYVGNYFVKLGGDVDALTFSGGIGEKSEELRKAVVDKVACLGFKLDTPASAKIGGVVTRLGPKVLVIKTDEEYEMALECAQDKRFWE